MRTDRWPRWLVPALLIAMMAPGPSSRAQEEEGKRAPMKKRPAPTQPEKKQPQTQTKPGDKTRAQTQTAPAEPGIHSVEGHVVLVNPARHAIVVRTTMQQYEVFVAPGTKLTRDGEPVGVEKVKRNDRVDACEFDAKHVARKISLTSGEKLGTIPQREPAVRGQPQPQTRPTP